MMRTLCTIWFLIMTIWLLQPNSNTSSHGCGTAFFINNKGDLVTAAHVFGSNTEGVIYVHDKAYIVNIIDRNDRNDVAVAHANLTSSYLRIQYPTFYAGKAIVYGYPMTNLWGNNLKASYGTGVYGQAIEPSRIALQLNIYPGNSGGPVVSNGVIGVEVEGVQRQSDGIGFSQGVAIPIDKVTEMLDNDHIWYEYGDAWVSDYSVVKICT